MSFIAAAVIGGGTALLGGIIGAGAASSAAHTQADAAGRATDAQLQMFNTINQQQAPYRQAGQTALSAMMGGMGFNVPSTGSQLKKIDWNDYLNRYPDVAASSVYGENPQAHYNDYGKKEGRTFNYITDQAGTSQAGGMPMPTREQFTSSPTAQAGTLGANQGDIHTPELGMNNPFAGQSFGSPSNFDQAGYDKAMSDWNAQQGQPGTNMAQTGGTPVGGIAPGYFTHQFDAHDLNANLAPNYQFQLDQGLGALKNAGNLQSGLISGNTLKGINDYAQNFAGGAYQNAFNNYTANQSNIFNRLSNIAGLGQTSTANTGNAGTSLAANAGNSMIAQGTAQAGGTVGAANAITGGLNNAQGWYTLSQIMNKGGSV